MKRKPIQHQMDGLIALLLFGVFAACVLAVLLTGASAYRRLVQRDQTAYERRTCAQYIATRVRQSDSLDGVSVSRLGDVPALSLAHGDGYLTQVYCYNGCLMELYAAEDAGLAPEDGEKLMEARALSASLSDGLLELSLTPKEGTAVELTLSLRSGEGAGA